MSGSFRFLFIMLVASLTALGCRGSGPVVTTTFPLPDETALAADLYGHGPRGLVLVAHGGYSLRESWAPQARLLADSGFRVLVFDTRGAIALRGGRETDCLYEASCMAVDVLAAVRYLRSTGARTVTVLGGSAGGGGAAQASVDAPKAIDRLILLAPMAIEEPARIHSRVLVVVSRGDLGPGDQPRLPGILEQYHRMPEPRELVILDGGAHAQRIFGSAEGIALTRTILRFLRSP